MNNKIIALLAAGDTPTTRKAVTGLIALGVALGTLLAPVPNARAQFRSMTGAKVMTIPGVPLSHFLVSYTVTLADSSGTNGIIKGNILAGDPTLGGAFTNAQYVTPFVGPITLIDTNTAQSTTVRYGMRNGTNGVEVVYIAVNNNFSWQTSPGVIVHTN